MLILGATADDKGAQLEALVAKILETEGYTEIRLNRVDSGGNELDISAGRETTAVARSQRVFLIGEAKAYRDTVAMPAWQRFLGKLYLARLNDPSTTGVFVALNGVNGNVAGSYREVRRRDTQVSIAEGADLERQLISTGQLADKPTVQALATRHFSREPEFLEPAFYGGGFFWVVQWPVAEYSVLGGRGDMLSAEHVESLRRALEGVLQGKLLLPDTAHVRAEAAHDARLELLNRLFSGDVAVPNDPADDDGTDEAYALRAVSAEPFAQVVGGRLSLRPATTLNAEAVCRLFQFIVSGPIKIRYLGFAEQGLHRPYLDRLIDLTPDVQAGFALNEADTSKLKAVAPLFPSLWALLSQPIAMIATHRVTQTDLPMSESLAASERNSFWEAVTGSMWSDFVNPWLQGFLYDCLGVAEIERRTSWVVKTKTEPVADITVEIRDAIKQLADEWVGQAGTKHTLVRMLQHAVEPWDEEHPAPVSTDTSQRRGAVQAGGHEDGASRDAGSTEGGSPKDGREEGTGEEGD